MSGSTGASAVRSVTLLFNNLQNALPTQIGTLRTSVDSSTTSAFLKAQLRDEQRLVATAFYELSLECARLRGE